jgi:hypothetical protein
MFARFPSLNTLLAWRNVGPKELLIAMSYVNRDLLVVKIDTDGGLYNYSIPGIIQALYCVPD